MENTIYIVSGMVRSGTSMMMKMLKEGGLEVFKTTPDEGNEFNPDGYFETSYIKGLKIAQDWIPQAYGKALKVFAGSLDNLPDNHYGPIKYKIIFMERDPMASAQSFAAMRGTELNLTEEFITERYEKVKAETDALIARKDNMEILYVKYDDVLANPEEECQKIETFLEVDLDLSKMVVIPNADRRHF